MPGAEAVCRGLPVALDEPAENGITSAGDAGGFRRQGHPEASERALEEGEPSVRAVNSLYACADLPPEEQLACLERRFSDDSDSLPRFGTARIYVDGILDLGTAWMLEPYDAPVDPEHPFGSPCFERDEFRACVSGLHRIGYRMHFHVIGDAAAREVLDAVEILAADPGEVADRRHRTTHTHLVHPDDREHFAALDAARALGQDGTTGSIEVGKQADHVVVDRNLLEIPVDRVDRTKVLCTVLAGRGTYQAAGFTP
ncbi:amidohydrolase family protein [Streptomyces omiyaensis]|uniref:amidohydrolase family protein n=1 Tax=Streptomyces omiyaensis TaxID=68247 RepID=UPI0036F97575